MKECTKTRLICLLLYALVMNVVLITNVVLYMTCFFYMLFFQGRNRKQKSVSKDLIKKF